MIIQTRIINVLSAPALPQIDAGNSPTGSTTFIVTPPVAAAAGSLLIVCFGGSVAGTPTAPSGWSQSAGSTSSFAGYCFVKNAGASEPATYTFTFSAPLIGGYSYMEFTGAENYSEFRILVPNAGTITSASYTPAAFDIPGAGVAISVIAKATITAFSPSVGWYLLQGAGQQKLGIKGYSNIQLSETITWTGTSTAFIHYMIFFKAKEIRF